MVIGQCYHPCLIILDVIIVMIHCNHVINMELNVWTAIVLSSMLDVIIVIVFIVPMLGRQWSVYVVITMFWIDPLTSSG